MATGRAMGGATGAGAQRRARERVRVHEGEHGRELIVDETFASLWRRDGPATGCVWDAIAAPLLLLPPERRRSILILGLGGGSAARLARALSPEATIVGVELDREVVRVARRAFDLDALGLELIVDDALAVLRRERRRFDAILEDVFVGHGDAVRKPDWVPEPALGLAARRLREGGLLVCNTLDEAPVVGRALAAAWPGVVRITTLDYDNRIFAAGPACVTARALRAAVAADPVLAGSLPLMRFRSWTRE